MGTDLLTLINHIFTFDRCFYSKANHSALKVGYICISMHVPLKSNQQPLSCHCNALPIEHEVTDRSGLFSV